MWPFYMYSNFWDDVVQYTHQCHRALSEVPHSEAIAGVRVGLLGDKFVVNPTTKEMEDSTLDLFLAGTDNAILMIEVNFNPNSLY